MKGCEGGGTFPSVGPVGEIGGAYGEACSRLLGC